MKIKYNFKDRLKPGDWVEVISLDTNFSHCTEALGFQFILSSNPRFYGARFYGVGFGPEAMKQFYSGNKTAVTVEETNKYSVNYKLENLRKLTKEEIIKYKKEGKI